MLPHTIFAQSSATSISFQGALNGPTGQPLPNGNYTLTFRFWDGPAPGGNAVSTNIPVANVPVAAGVASTAIPVDPAWFNGQTRYLGVTVGGGSELLPRVLVTAVPYAMAARYLNGPLIDLLVPSDPEGGFWSIQPSAFVGGDGYFGIVRYAPSADWGKSLVITPQGNVAIGTLFPHSKLEVNGNAEIIGKLKTKVIDLQVPSDPDSGFWSIQPDAFFPGQFGILRYQPTADPVRSLLIAPNGNVGIGVDQPRATFDVNGTARMTVCQITSDRNAKDRFASVNPRDVLAKLADIPISTWVYTHTPGIRHIGPVAQDFAAAFAVGEDDKHIATVDADGVALAAIQGLNQKLEEQLKDKDARIHDLETRLNQIERKLESRLANTRSN